ncbi:MAG: hypothetical protein GWP62_07200 [Gammaproteobacteria bacterium]|nr:hypothetical protein [Gammaproteobacteria bacterium]
MNHRVGQSVFALVVGLAVAVIAYQWITNPAPRQQRQIEELAVQASRELLAEAVGVGSLEIVDPLAPNRKVGKVYIYAEEPGWAVSGYYRRDDNDRWHPYLLHMTADLEMHAFKAEDEALDIKE